MKIKVSISYDEKNDYYIAQCAVLAELASKGDSEEEALENLKEVVDEYFIENETHPESEIEYEIE